MVPDVSKQIKKERNPCLQQNSTAAGLYNPKSPEILKSCKFFRVPAAPKMEGFPFGFC